MNAAQIGQARVPDSGAPWSVSQLAGPAEPDISQRQIPQSAVEDQLTVSQLQTYVDRCQAGAAPPPGLDCSGLRLRVERLFRSDDEVARALLVLDRLADKAPRSGSATETFVRRAVASGALLLETPPPAPEPEPELPEDIPLDGLPIGAIIGNSGG